MSYSACVTSQLVTEQMNSVLAIHSKFLAGDGSVPDAAAARNQTESLLFLLEEFELNFEVVSGLEVYTDQERLAESKPERLTSLYQNGSSLVHITRYYKVCTSADIKCVDPKQALVFTASFTDHPNGGSLVHTSSIDVLNVDSNQLNDGVCSGLKLTKIRDHESVDEIVLLTCEKEEENYHDNGYHSDHSCDVIVKVKQEGKPTEIIYSSDPYAHYDNCDEHKDDHIVVNLSNNELYKQKTDLPALTGLLSGEAEVDDSVSPPVFNKGDPDGEGDATVTPLYVFEKKLQMEVPNGSSGSENITAIVKCVKAKWKLNVKNIEEPNRFHIHQGEIDKNGPVVVFFFDFVVDPPVQSDSLKEGIVDIDLSLYEEIVANAQGYYFNVHNEEFPAGALRSQLYLEHKKKNSSPVHSEDQHCSYYDFNSNDHHKQNDYDTNDECENTTSSYDPCYMWKENVATHYWDGEKCVYVECDGYSGDNYHYYYVGDDVYEMCNQYFDGKEYHDVEGVYKGEYFSTSSKNDLYNSHNVNTNDGYKSEDNNDYKSEDNNDYKSEDNNDYKSEDNNYYKSEDNNDYKSEDNNCDVGYSDTYYYYYCRKSGEYYQCTHCYDGHGYYQTDYNDQNGGYNFYKDDKTFHKCTHVYSDGEYKAIFSGSSVYNGEGLFSFYNSQ